MHGGHVAHGDLNEPIGRFGQRLGFVEGFVDQLGRVALERFSGRGFGEVHQLGDDVAETLGLIVNEPRGGLLFRVR